MNPEDLYVDFNRDTSEGAHARARDLLTEYGGFLAHGLLTESDLEPVIHEVRQLIDMRMKVAGLADATDSDGMTRFDDGFRALNELDRRHGGVIYQACPRLTALHSLSVHPALVNMSKVLMSTDMIVSSNSKAIRIDQPNEDTYLFQWHQDYPYNLDSEDGLVYWLPLHDVDQLNGYLAIAPQSHKRGLLPVTMSDPSNSGNNRAKTIDIAEKGIVEEFEHVNVGVKKGDVLVFSTMLLHASNPNRSTRSRWTIQIRHGNYRHPQAIKRNWPGNLKEGPRFDEVYSEYVVQSSAGI